MADYENIIGAIKMLILLLLFHIAHPFVIALPKVRKEKLIAIAISKR